MNNTFYNNIMPVYNVFTQKQLINNIPTNLVNIANKVAKKVDWDINITGYKNNFTIENVPTNKKVMVGLSAGLDSAYMLTKLIDDGYEVIAVHIKGLNNMAKQEEYEQAIKIANLCNVELITIELNTPKQYFADNPFKNQLILSLMLDKGIENNCYCFGVGSDWTTSLEEGVVGFTITDTKEVNQEFWNDVNEHWKQAELFFIDDNVKKKDRIEYLYKNHKEVFENISSCIAPHRFKKYWKQLNETKYNIQLLDNRCGNCYKCCMEYLLLCELGLVAKNEQYYNHCWQILSNSKNAHRPDLFSSTISLEERVNNLLNYGS